VNGRGLNKIDVSVKQYAEILQQSKVGIGVCRRCQRNEVHKQINVASCWLEPVVLGRRSEYMQLRNSIPLAQQFNGTPMGFQGIDHGLSSVAGQYPIGSAGSE
jgi:hypothetical protein